MFIKHCVALIIFYVQFNYLNNQTNIDCHTLVKCIRVKNYILSSNKKVNSIITQLRKLTMVLSHVTYLYCTVWWEISGKVYEEGKKCGSWLDSGDNQCGVWHLRANLILFLYRNDILHSHFRGLYHAYCIISITGCHENVYPRFNSRKRDSVAVPLYLTIFNFRFPCKIINLTIPQLDKNKFVIYNCTTY